ncbi:helix-turn-helix domain-containing protein [Vibrio campbellii]|uniref:helix-turn-helix domain-containing protein n=1 Tax=Vibrio campbellii TaxID=680 RepID=UPI0009B810EC
MEFTLGIDTAIRIGIAKENINTTVFAERCGVVRSTVSRWVNNKTKPSVTVQRRMAKIFRVSYDEFIRWSEYK